MEELYQNSPYSYFPQNTYHQHNNNMYRLNHTTFDNRPFHIPSINENESTTESYGWNNQNHHYSQHHFQPRNMGYCNMPPSSALLSSPRPKITTNVWEDEGTMCYQVDAKGICVARRQDNDMINGTKLLNVVGMSRGKRDGILKNEKGRVVVKVGAMHLKGVWIPFNRARELASKFKIMDILFPLFVEEPSVYLNLPIDAAQHDSNKVPPTDSNKCNIVSSPQSVFNHHTKNRSDEYSSSSPVGIPTNWDRSYQLTSTSSHYGDHPSSQTILHRTASHSDLQSSPVPRSMLHHSHTTTEENNEFYLLNNQQQQNENHTYDYYNRQLNRSSISSLSSHHSYLYPSFASHQEEDTSCYNKTVLHSDPYTKSSPYTANTTSIQETTTNKPSASASAVVETAKSSAGSTTPSSWLSPETPTAVLFQHKEKEESTSMANSKKRKSSLSIEPTQQAILSPTSPATRAVKKAKVQVKTEN